SNMPMSNAPMVSPYQSMPNTPFYPMYTDNQTLGASQAPGPNNAFVSSVPGAVSPYGYSPYPGHADWNKKPCNCGCHDRQAEESELDVALADAESVNTRQSSRSGTRRGGRKAKTASVKPSKKSTPWIRN
ncbi:hypothetical protein, partial [Paenibacillus koleovorans]|uniref:hypothetical protein n=1 Tax=Paenibacillus koleovorans TaxID=121608 RepID=UPI0013E38C69